MNNEYLIVSDIHGYNKKLANELMNIVKSESVPKYVFFLGDIVGNSELDALQKKFYDVFNKMKTIEKDCPNDMEIIKNVYTEISELNITLIGISCSFRPPDTVEWAKRIASFKHFGHFISCLPVEIKNHLKNGLKKNANKMIKIMIKFANAGSKVIVVEGNWDTNTPLDFYPTENECKPLPVNKRSFYLKKYINFMDKRILYCDSFTEIESKNTIFLILPFSSAIDYKPGSLNHKKTNKEVILISHAHVKWYSIMGSTPMTEENAKIDKNMFHVMNDLRPDLVIHGHLHIGIDNEYSIFLAEKTIKVKYLPMRTFLFI